MPVTFAKKISGRSLILIGCLAFAGCVLTGLAHGIPRPHFHDEFSYLLAADTFSLGRITNPTHPLWHHFESFHIIHEPTYMSKYPPGQGLFMALGQITSGEPIAGVWLTMALMTAAMTWMFAAWLPPGWALFGGLLCILHPKMGVAGYWAQSYWGGAVAALGGALFFGAVPRLIKKIKMKNTFTLGIGIALLANSRPYEGLLVTAPAVVFLFFRLVQKNPPGARSGILKKIILPLGIILAISAAAMGYYNHRITGNALEIPYSAYDRSYAMAPNFIWENPPPKPEYRHPQMKRYYELYSHGTYLRQRAPENLLKNMGEKTIYYLGFFAGSYTGLFWILPLLALLTGDKRIYPVYFILLMVLAGDALTCWWHPHYPAPAAPLFFLCVLSGLRQIFLIFGPKKRSFGTLVLVSFFAFWATEFIIQSRDIRFAALKPFQRKPPPGTKLSSHDWAAERHEIFRHLAKTGEKHLIIVRYGPFYPFHREWVYNAADIDGSEVVWARDRGEEKNRELVNYFKDRKIWVLEAMTPNQPGRLLPYPGTSGFPETSGDETELN